VINSAHSKNGGFSSNSVYLRRVFVRRVHQLVLLGYERLTPSTYGKAEEPSITGDLVEAIDQVLSERYEPWMSMFSVHDDPPVNDGRRKGKRRKRVDLRIDSGAVRPRARFRFESKRLGRRHTVKIYLGTDGLGCFLRGDYAREEDQAGMLGYVQRGNLSDWGNKIAQELAKTPALYAVDSASPFCIKSTWSAASQAYHSGHNRTAVGRPILIDHILLVFY
jgi:hypothetical protein